MLRKTVIGSVLATLALAAGAAQAYDGYGDAHRNPWRDRIAAERNALYNAQAQRAADLQRLRFDQQTRNFAGVERDRAMLAHDRQVIAATRAALERDEHRPAGYGWHEGRG